MNPRWATATTIGIDAWDLDEESGIRERSASPPPSRAYRMDARAEALLHDNSDLIPLLDEACGKLRELFGADAIFELERFDDPESPMCDPMLLFVIRTPTDPDISDALLKRFDEEWWIDNVSGAGSELEFMVRST